MTELGLVDCTLREGDQAAGVAMDPSQKLDIALRLDAAGVALADAGMPAVGEGERAFLAEAAQRCTRMTVGASVRCRPDMVALAAETGVGAVFVICPISRLHMAQRIGTDLPGLLAALGAAAQVAHDAGMSLEVVCEDASRAHTEDLHALVRTAADVGARRVYIADTVGCRTPAGFAALVADVVAIAPAHLGVGVHCHDDLGMATANTVAAIEAGARWPTACVNGLGERAGNARLGEVALACAQLLGLDTGIDPTQLPGLAAAVAAASGIPVSPMAPLVGRNAFRHESGIHVDGMLKDPRTYEAVDPALLGRERRLVLGKHTGRAHLRALLHDRGVTPSQALVTHLQGAVQARAVQTRGEVPLDELWDLCRAAGLSL